MRVGGVDVELEREQVLRRVKGVKPDPIRKLGVEIGGRTYPVKQVFSLVTGQDIGDFDSYQARKALKKLGFQVTRT